MPFHGPLWLLGQVPFNLAVRKEMKRAAREEYAEDRRLEAAGLDVPVRGGKINWQKFGITPEHQAHLNIPMYTREVDEGLDWDKLVAGDDPEGEDDWE